MQRSGKKPVNCIPCAKRKVKCDKEQPCGHCKRRKGDVCEYFDPYVGFGRARSAEVQASAGRIEKLEQYVRRLGGDLSAIENDEDGDAGSGEDLKRRKVDASTAVTAATTDGSGAKTFMSKRRGLPANGTALVDDDGQTTYVEAPVWYSWTGATPEDQNAHTTATRQNQTRVSNCFPALLDPRVRPGRESLYPQNLRPTQMLSLWRYFLKNVHPLVKIFFDWEIEPMISRASGDCMNLTDGEQALLSSIYFITTLSLSEDDCVSLLYESKASLLDKFQAAAEDALVGADFIATSDRTVLQAFILYILAMRNRTRPATLFSLLGIANRTAERMGIHRDGVMLGLSVLRSEERRRIWWQLQYMEIAIAQLLGTISMLLYADWDTKMPSNLEDSDLTPDHKELPPVRKGLTSIAHCLWRYNILFMQREHRLSDGSMAKMISLHYSQMPLSKRDEKIDQMEKALGEQYLQYCDPLKPLDVYIQIGVRSFILAARRGARQPALVNAKISDMSRAERDDFLAICTQAMDYTILSETTEALRGFQWHNTFQWAALVYIILEAHNRFDEDAVVDLWSLIRRVYAVYSDLSNSTHRQDIAAIAHIAVTAWQRHDTHIREQRQQEHGFDFMAEHEPPQWIVQLCQKFDLPHLNSTTASTDSAAQLAAFDGNQLLGLDFDFDSVDLSMWDESRMNAALYANNG